MRSLAVTMTLAASLACAVISASAHGSKSVSVKVILRVKAKPCVFRTPALVSTEYLVNTRIILSSILSGCALDEAPATLTVRADSADKGTDVATINF